MLSMTGGWISSFEPINLMADYYGEKYAMYFAFLVHTLSW